MPDRNRLVVFGIPEDAKESDLESSFSKYGKILDVALRRERDQGQMAFIDYDDERDARDALEAR